VFNGDEWHAAPAKATPSATSSATFSLGDHWPRSRPVRKNIPRNFPVEGCRGNQRRSATPASRAASGNGFVAAQELSFD